MWHQIITLIEILSIIACIHSIYGKKPQFNRASFTLLSTLMTLVSVINYYQLNGLFSWILYIPIFIYCWIVFKKSLARTVLHLVISIILLALIQFIMLVITMMICPNNLLIRNFLACIGCLMVCVWMLPVLPLRGLSSPIHHRGFYLTLLGIISAIVFFMLFQVKYLGHIQIASFIFAVPLMLLLLVMLGKWNIQQASVEHMSKELHTVNYMQKSYAKLLTNVRLRQHGFKNHLAAILGAHYTYNSYEKLVRAQEEYCHRLLQESRFDGLLHLGNNVLAGFLYEKFQQLEAEGAVPEYKIEAHPKDCLLPTYYLIEILGILLDNALEAIQTQEEKKICLTFSETENQYLFLVCNRSIHRSYQEIEQWFQMGVSSKGNERGLGLYHVRCLCQEFDCNICCQNRELDGENWIEFILYIGKGSLLPDIEPKCADRRKM